MSRRQRERMHHAGPAMAESTASPAKRSAQIDRKIALSIFALYQQSHVMPRPRDFALELSHSGDAHTIDPQHHVPGLQAGGQRRARHILDQQTALGSQFLLLAGL